MPSVRRYSQHAGNTCGSLTYGVRRYSACGRWGPVFTVFTKLLKCVHKKQKTTRFPSDSAVGPILLEFARRQSEIQNSRVYPRRGVMASQHSWAICFFWGANCPIIERLREWIMLRVRAGAMVAQAHISRGEPGAESAHRRRGDPA